MGQRAWRESHGQPFEWHANFSGLLQADAASMHVNMRIALNMLLTPQTPLTSTGSKPSSRHTMSAELVLPMPGGPLSSTAFFFTSSGFILPLQQPAASQVNMGTWRLLLLPSCRDRHHAIEPCPQE